MYNLSVEISDSIAADFQGKLGAVRRLGLGYIEIDECINGKKLYEMSGAETEVLRDQLIDANIRIVLLTTKLRPDQHEAFKQLFRRCVLLNIGAVKVSVKRADDTGYIEQLSRCMSIPLCIENAAEGEYRDEGALLEAVRTHGFNVIFNPLEFVRTERHPFLNAYYACKIKEDIGFLRINDGLYRTHAAILVGHGCAEVKELASIMLSRSYNGWFSFTPYLLDMDLDKYVACINTFKTMLKNM